MVDTNYSELHSSTHLVGNTVSKDANSKSYLSEQEYETIHSYFEAANYLSVGQVYLKDNVLLQQPLKKEHIKPRLLGHFGTVPGLNLLYTHLNRCIKQQKLNMIFLTGPGHGGPALIAQAYLEQHYTEIYSKVSLDEQGIKNLFRQFSTPGGIPSHVSPPTPGSIHEGGELGYVLVHAAGAAFDNPDLIVTAVVGDGEAETGPLEGSWKIINFLNPVHDGAVLPILHLNGYKIAGPTVLGRESDENIAMLMRGHGYEPYFVEGDDPKLVHHYIAATLDKCIASIKQIQKEARSGGGGDKKTGFQRPKWPMIVMRTPKGWTGPDKVDNIQIQGTFRAHQVPMTDVLTNQEHLKVLEDWLKSYHPDKHFEKDGKLKAKLRELTPEGEYRMSANPHCNGGKLTKALKMPDIKDFAYDIKEPGTIRKTSTTQLGLMMRDLYKLNPTNFRFFCPDETVSNKLNAVFEVDNRGSMAETFGFDDHVTRNGRVLEVLSEHLCEGWLEAYNLTGRHGMFASYEAFMMIIASMVTQHSKWLEACQDLPWRVPVPSLNLLLTSTCWRNDHNGFSHQGPGLMNVVMNNKGSVARIYLPPDANCMLSVAEHCFTSKHYVNLIVIDKQPQLQYLSLEDAKEHCKKGISTWEWACSPALQKNSSEKPDVIICSAGDIVTMEALAAADLLRQKAPDMKVRFINVVDLMTLHHHRDHPHGMSAQDFERYFGSDIPIVFAFHGYAGAIHSLVHSHVSPARFHVRGYEENGTTTTPFLMTVLNEISRFHLVKVVLKHCHNKPKDSAELSKWCDEQAKRAVDYAEEHYQDEEEITNWTWKHGKAAPQHGNPTKE